MNKKEINVIDKEYINEHILKFYNPHTFIRDIIVSSESYIAEVTDAYTLSLKCVVYISLSDEPLDKLDVHNIFKKLEDSYRCMYAGIDYKILSKSGYVDMEDSLCKASYEQFGLKLLDYSYLDSDVPVVDLISHNQYTYNQVTSYLSCGIKDICSIQPTGTGKSFLIGKYVSDFISDRVLLLSPSTYILDQFKSTFSWMKNNPNIRMMTYTKLSFLSESEWEELIKFNPGSICIDEYHRLGATSWGSAYNKLITNLRSQDCGYELKTFGVTATPLRFLDKNRDMSSELFDSNIANEITLFDAIAKSILPMPKYVTVFHDISVDTKRVKDKISKSKASSTVKKQLKARLREIVKTWTATLSVVPIIKKHITTERKFVVFCENQQHVDDMIVRCKEWFELAFDNKIPVNTYKVLSSYKYSAKDYALFESADNTSFNLLFSVNSINEGVHPDIDGVIFCRNTTSGIIYYQQQGRCFKVGTGKTPLVLDLVNNVYTIGQTSFESKVEEAIELENKKRAEVGLPPVDDYIQYKHNIKDESQEVLRMFSDLENRLFTAWDENYLKAIQYYEKNNHIYVEKEEDKQLCSWLSKMRTLYKNNKLSDEKIEKLKKLDFDFDLKDYLFNKHYIKLKSFFTENNHSRVPNTYHDLTLYNWVTTCRAKYINGELSEAQIEKLNELSFVWNVNDLEWLIGYDELKEFFDRFGHSNVTISNSNSRLFNFKSRNKKMYKQGKLSDERISLLKLVEFDFSTQEDSFETKLQTYKEYVLLHSTPLVEKKYNPELNSWLCELRKNYKNGLISEDRVIKLNEIGMVWDVYEYKWSLNVDSMKEYYLKYGSLDMTGKKEYESLKKWIQSQKREYLSGTLVNNRKVILDEFDFMNKIP